MTTKTTGRTRQGSKPITAASGRSKAPAPTITPATPMPTPSGRGSTAQAPTKGTAQPIAPPSVPAFTLEDPRLFMLAAEVHDFELQRMGSTSRYERAIREEGVTDKDGKYRGLGLPVDDPVVHNLMEARDAITAVEEGLIKALVKVMRQHPLGPWQKAQRGIGEKQLARLLNVIGDPYWNAAKNQPRRVSDLWSSGHQHMRGMRAIMRELLRDLWIEARRLHMIEGQ